MMVGNTRASVTYTRCLITVLNGLEQFAIRIFFKCFVFYILVSVEYLSL